MLKDNQVDSGNSEECLPYERLFDKYPWILSVEIARKKRVLYYI